MTAVAMTVNGKTVSADVEPRTLLVQFLRENLRLTGTHVGCDTSQCGACVVHLNGRAIKSCTMLAVSCEGAKVTTIEGMAEGGQLHPLQETFADLGAAQCGYCTPAFLLVAKELLEKNVNASRDEIKEALAGNLCRCTGYIKIYEAVELAAARMRGETAEPSRESIFGFEV